MKNLIKAILCTIVCIATYSAYAQPTTIKENYADLSLSDFRVTSLTNQEVKYTYTVTNIGNKTALLNDVTIQMFFSLSSDHYTEKGGKAGGGFIMIPRVSQLSPGESVSGTFTASGNFKSYKICTMYVDIYNKVTESQKQNNARIILIN